MYLPLEDNDNKMKSHPFYNHLCDDVLGHVIGFLGDEEKAECCYVNLIMRQLICDHSPQTYIPICRRCQRYIKRCTCPSPKNGKCCNRIVSIVVIVILVFLVGAFIVAMTGDRLGWF